MAKTDQGPECMSEIRPRPGTPVELVADSTTTGGEAGIPTPSAPENSSRKNMLLTSLGSLSYHCAPYLIQGCLIFWGLQQVATQGSQTLADAVTGLKGGKDGYKGGFKLCNLLKGEFWFRAAGQCG